MTRLLWYNPIPNQTEKYIQDDLIDSTIGAEFIRNRKTLEAHLREIANAQNENHEFTYSARPQTPFVILDLPPYMQVKIAQVYTKRFGFHLNDPEKTHFPFYFIPILTDEVGVYYQERPIPLERAAQHIADEIEIVLDHMNRNMTAREFYPAASLTPQDLF